MPVATIPAYDKMWVHPQVVAAISDGRFTYLPAEPWRPDRAYDEGDAVLYGPGAYGGGVFVAQGPLIGFSPDVGPDGGFITTSACGWMFDQEATLERLRLWTAILQATWLLDSLTGWRLHGVECFQEDYQPWTCTIRLRRQPVEHVAMVEWVHRCNQAGDPPYEVAGWCHDSVNTVSLCCGGGLSHFDHRRNEMYGTPGYPNGYYGACGCGRTVRVTYQIASNLPPGTEALVAWLATEYSKATSGQACALPERITNISRQGVSWTILDPQDFLDKGMTGISRVDNWLNPVKMSLGGQLIDPLTSTRLFSKQVDCLEPTPWRDG